MTANPSSAPQARWRLLAELTLPAAQPPGTEAASAIAASVHELSLPAARLAQLQTALAEAVLNAGRPGTAGQDTRLRVLLAAGAETAEQGCAARGWGFFIIEASGLPGQPEAGQGLELFLYREGAAGAGTGLDVPADLRR